MRSNFEEYYEEEGSEEESNSDSFWEEEEDWGYAGETDDGLPVAATASSHSEENDDTTPMRAPQSGENPFDGMDPILQTKSSAPAPSPSTDDKGWSTGQGSSSFSSPGEKQWPSSPEEKYVVARDRQRLTEEGNTNIPEVFEEENFADFSQYETFVVDDNQEHEEPSSSYEEHSYYSEQNDAENDVHRFETDVAEDVRLEDIRFDGEGSRPSDTRSYQFEEYVIDDASSAEGGFESLRGLLSEGGDVVSYDDNEDGSEWYSEDDGIRGQKNSSADSFSRFSGFYSNDSRIDGSITSNRDDFFGDNVSPLQQGQQLADWTPDAWPSKEMLSTEDVEFAEQEDEFEEETFQDEDFKVEDDYTYEEDSRSENNAFFEALQTMEPTRSGSSRKDPKLLEEEKEDTIASSEHISKGFRSPMATSQDGRALTSASTMISIDDPTASKHASSQSDSNPTNSGSSHSKTKSFADDIQSSAMATLTILSTSGDPTTSSSNAATKTVAASSSKSTSNDINSGIGTLVSMDPTMLSNPSQYQARTQNARRKHDASNKADVEDRRTTTSSVSEQTTMATRDSVHSVTAHGQLTSSSSSDNKATIQDISTIHGSSSSVSNRAAAYTSLSSGPSSSITKDSGLSSSDPNTTSSSSNKSKQSHISTKLFSPRKGGSKMVSGASSTTMQSSDRMVSDSYGGVESALSATLDTNQATTEFSPFLHPSHKLLDDITEISPAKSSSTIGTVTSNKKSHNENSTNGDSGTKDSQGRSMHVTELHPSDQSSGRSREIGSPKNKLMEPSPTNSSGGGYVINRRRKQRRGGRPRLSRSNTSPQKKIISTSGKDNSGRRHPQSHPLPPRPPTSDGSTSHRKEGSRHGSRSSYSKDERSYQSAPSQQLRKRSKHSESSRSESRSRSKSSLHSHSKRPLSSRDGNQASSNTSPHQSKPPVPSRHNSSSSTSAPSISSRSRGSRSSKPESKSWSRQSTTDRSDRTESGGGKGSRIIRGTSGGWKQPRKASSGSSRVNRSDGKDQSSTSVQSRNDRSFKDFENLKFSSSVLKVLDCGFRSKTRPIHATIENEGYMAFVTKAYYSLLKVRPRLQYLLSPAEWLHVHMLLLYARMFECELYYHNIRLPKAFRIAIPTDLVVFEPIASIISSIGILEDIDRGVTYIPVARFYRSGIDGAFKPHDKDDVTEFLEWTQYGWNASWERVEEGRSRRRKMAAEKHMTIPETDAKFDTSKLEEWQQLAVEKWLGWDDDLWFSYQQACFVLGRTARFVPLPRDKSKKGSYAWLLPKHKTEMGSYVRIPKPNLSPETWMIALMLEMCALEPAAMTTWYYETNVVTDVEAITDRFLGAAITLNQS